MMAWVELLALVETHGPKGGKGRSPEERSILMRFYFVQHWFALCIPPAGDAFSLLRFVDVDLRRMPAPDQPLPELPRIARAVRSLRRDVEQRQPLSG